MAKNKTVELPWRSNFRDVSLLPDIKSVRSVFFVNFALMTLTIVLAFIWIFLEWQIGTLNGLLGGYKKEIEFRKSSNEELLKQSAEFERWAKIINEIQGFVGIPIKPSSFLQGIGEARAPRMTLTQLSYMLEPRQVKADAKAPEAVAAAAGKDKKPAIKNAVVYAITIAGTITGTSSQATKTADQFRDRLEKLPAFKGMAFNLKPTLKTFERDKGLEMYTFIINMEVRL